MHFTEEKTKGRKINTQIRTEDNWYKGYAYNQKEGKSHVGDIHEFKTSCVIACIFYD